MTSSQELNCNDSIFDCEADSASFLPCGESPPGLSSNEVRESRALSFVVSKAKQIIITKILDFSKIKYN